MYKFKTKVIISYKGENTWFAPTIIRSKCNINLTYFPFDDQFCELRFGSWTYTDKEVDIQMGGNIDLDKYLNSSQFKLLSVKARRNETKAG